MILEDQDVNQVPVAAGDRLVGMITRDHLLRVLAAKMELELPMGQARSGHRQTLCKGAR
ncbi:MAG TPA: hypothetical protein VLE46_06885 [Nitrospira sp.]|nr:hypothetical protein [Nitrospira sp.]